MSITPEQWIMGRDTGISSITIWSVMMGVPYNGGVPWDCDDFGRCYRLLLSIPSWRGRLPEVAARHKGWGPIIREWEQLERLYLQWLSQDRGAKAWHVFFDTMHALRIEGMLADGWIQTSPGGFWWRGA